MHNDFTLVSRKVPSGKTVVYYYAYNGEGQRLGPWTTGQVNKTAARNYCNLLNRKGKLLQNVKGMPTFSEFSQGFWDWENSPYLKDRRKRAELTRAYVDKAKMVYDNHLEKYFGKMPLDTITSETIEAWFDHLITKEKLKHTTINGYYKPFKTMLRWAVKKRVLLADPTLDIQKLSDDRKDLKIITPEELRALFGKNWRQVWDNDRIVCTANKLAALTGMRTSEVLGLKGEYVYTDHIYVCAQFDKYGYRPTKTKDTHNIPLLADIIAELEELKAVNGQGFLFSENGGETPIKRRDMYDGYMAALKRIGFTENDIKKRGLNLHAWRHFANTELQKGGLSVKQVQSVTNHKSTRMTELYTHFDPMEFGDVPKIQAELLNGTTERQEEKPTLSIVRLTETGTQEKAS